MKSFFWLLATLVTTLSATDFSEITPLPSALKTQMIDTGTWKPGCPIELDRLRLVKFAHYDFSGEQQTGEIVVLEAVAARVATIFKTLYQHQFPIAQAKTIDHYAGQDKPSMAANNTSAFNYRPIAGKTTISLHSYGVAIDVNPIQNPCIEPQTLVDAEEIRIPVQPAAGQDFLNRANIRSGMVEQTLDKSSGLNVVELFKQNGFYIWGGSWNDPIDWQHFQPSRAVAEWLAFMSPEDATLLFELYLAKPKLLNTPKVRDYNFKKLYENNRSKFMKALQTSEFWELSPEEAYNSLN